MANLVFGPVSATALFIFANPFTPARARVTAYQTRFGGGSGLRLYDTITTVVVIAVAVFAVVNLAVLIWCLVKMRQGRNWARITLTVFAGLGIAGTLLGLIQAVSAISYVAAPVTVALYVGALILMYRPAANAYFTGPGRQ